MQECSQLYYNYTILLLNFRRSCRGSTRSSARNWRETWRELPNFPSNKGHLRALFDCRIHSFTFVFLTSKTTPSLNISPRSRSSRHDLPPSPTYLLSKLRYFHESRIASYHIDMARFTSAIPENRFIKFISLSVPNWTNRSKRHYLAEEKKKNRSESEEFVAGNQYWTVSLYSLLLRICLHLFRSLEIIPRFRGKWLSKNSELGSHGYPMRVNGILDHLVVKVRATSSRAHVATAANRVLLDLAKRSISGCGRVAEVLPLQEHRDLPEGWPLALLPPPAVEHQIVNILGARGRLR